MTTLPRTYLVCGTPRSGSALVCDALAATGAAGSPGDHFEAICQSGRPGAHGIDLDPALAAGTGPSGVFGARVTWGQLAELFSRLSCLPAHRDASFAELLSGVFGELTFVRVVRANKLRQAVSVWEAMQTGEPRTGPRLDYPAVSDLHRRILAEEARWDGFFEHPGIGQLLVRYEDFTADYEKSALDLLERLDLSAPEGEDDRPPAGRLRLAADPA